MDQNAAAQISDASLELLDNPGVRIEHDGIIEKLLRAGARRGKDAQVIRFPRELVMESLELAPSEVFLADRDGTGKTLSVVNDTLNWTNPGMYIFRGGEHRKFNRKDLADVSRLVDQVPNIDGMFGMALADVPTNAQDVIGLRTMAENTAKHIRVLSFSAAGADILCQMKEVVGDYPWFSVGFTAHGPLRWTYLALEIFARTAGKGLPTTINGEPMAGASGPTTLAGSAAVGNAEILAGLVINQVLDPGRPCIYNLGLAHIIDMKTSIAVTGAPENHLYADISAAMGRYYNIPSCSWVSTESMSIDSQTGMEKSIGYFTHLQSGVSLIWGAGQLESELTLSPAQILIDDETISYVRRYQRGVTVNEETLAVDVTRSVGIAGHYLGDPHTMKHFRTEFFQPSLLFRKNRDAWDKRGGKLLAQVAEEKADALMANELAEKLTAEQRVELRKIEDAFLATL